MRKTIMLAGDPVIALFTGMLLALLLVKEKSFDGFNTLFSGAIEKAGPILIVTAAGGMFGAVIKSTGIGEVMGEYLAGINLGLMVPFIIAFLLKTAQGSSTVAIITTASFVAPMLAPLGLNSEWGRMLAVLAMGAGSMIVSHANDSYFWVISNFAGVDIDTNLRVYSTSTVVMGCVVFIFIWVTSLLVI
jgi:GntP family gluconate:H+ symporter